MLYWGAALWMENTAGEIRQISTTQCKTCEHWQNWNHCHERPFFWATCKPSVSPDGTTQFTQMICQKVVQNQVHDQLYERSLKAGCVVTMRTDNWTWWRKLWINAVSGAQSNNNTVQHFDFLTHISLYFVSVHPFPNQLATTASFSSFFSFLMLR